MWAKRGAARRSQLRARGPFGLQCDLAEPGSVRTFVQRLRESFGALLLPDFLRAPEVAIVNFTSILALHPKRSAPVYCATKAGLRSFTNGLRYQLADHRNVRVIEVVPPVVDTGMTAGRGTGKIPPGDVAAAMVEGLESGRDAVHVGKARTVRVLNRLAPGLVTRILAGS